MASPNFFVAVALFATVALLFEGVAASKNIKRDISQLTSVERLLLRATHPELYNTWFGRSIDKTAEEYNPIDLLDFDLPTLALQLSRAGGEITIPSLTYSFGFYFCYIGVCAGFNQDYDYRNPEMLNANLTSLNTKINATNIELDFNIPDLRIISEDFTMVDTDLVTGDVVAWRGLTWSITNYTIQLTANLEYVSEVGIQVSNVSMNFEVGDFRIRKENATHTYPGGESEEWGEVETQYADQMREDWAEIGGDVTAAAELFLNCYLTQGRNGNADCEEFLANKHQTENFVQLLQTIGLGILRNQEELDRNVVAEIKKEDNLLNFVPNFPTPEISSILVELSTFILQSGKLLYDKTYNEIPFEGYVLSYDKTREDCNNGTCRNIHHQMVLPAWILGGFADNNVQLDIQPSNFSYSLKVPSNYLNSDSYQYELTDVDNRNKEVYLGLQLSVADAAFALTGNYEFEEGVGLQVSDLGITLQLGELQVRVPQFYTVENGTESDIQEFKVDAAPQIMEIWSAVDEDGVKFERKYEQQMQELLNSYLSDGRSIQKLFS